MASLCCCGERCFQQQNAGHRHEIRRQGVPGQAAADYLRVLRAIAPKAACVTDKMPFNFIWAGLIHLAFPRATIIHCRRAAVDTALSIHQTYFHSGLAFRPEVPN